MLFLTFQIEEDLSTCVNDLCALHLHVHDVATLYVCTRMFSSVKHRYHPKDVDPVDPTVSSHKSYGYPYEKENLSCNLAGLTVVW